MKVKLSENLNSLMGHCVINHIKPDDVQLVCDDVYKQTGLVDMDLKINGIEVNVSDFFDDLTKYIDKTIDEYKSRAISELNLESVKETYDKLTEIIESVDDLSNKIINVGNDFELDNRL